MKYWKKHILPTPIRSTWRYLEKRHEKQVAKILVEQNWALHINIDLILDYFRIYNPEHVQFLSCPKISKNGIEILLTTNEKNNILFHLSVFQKWECQLLKVDSTIEFHDLKQPQDWKNLLQKYDVVNIDFPDIMVYNGEIIFQNSRRDSTFTILSMDGSLKQQLNFPSDLRYQHCNFCQSQKHVLWRTNFPYSILIQCRETGETIFKMNLRKYRTTVGIFVNDLIDSTKLYFVFFDATKKEYFIFDVFTRHYFMIQSLNGTQIQQVNKLIVIDQHAFVLVQIRMKDTVYDQVLWTYLDQTCYQPEWELTCISGINCINDILWVNNVFYVV